MQEMTLDKHDYAPDAQTVLRTAVRGIIYRDGKYLMVLSDRGDCKFPGGGMQPGERLEDTLRREVQEETGYRVVQAEATPLILIHEKRCGLLQDLLQMDSYYFRCTVEETAGSQSLDQYEAERGFSAVWLEADEILARMADALRQPDMPWAEREECVMQEIIRQQPDWDVL